MLVIRMQRTGRKGHAMFRVVVQDSRRTPTSGKLVARLGSYDPHTKTAILDKEKIAYYLEHGAQPSDRIARLLKAEGVKLPSWVKLEADKARKVRNAEKRRSTSPEEPKEEVEAAASSEPVADSQTEDAAASSEQPTADSENADEAPVAIDAAEDLVMAEKIAEVEVLEEAAEEVVEAEAEKIVAEAESEEKTEESAEDSKAKA